MEWLESRELFAVTYHGGALIDQVEAQAVFIGTNWNTDSTLTQQKNRIDTFVRDIVQSPYMDLLDNAGYRVGRGVHLQEVS